MTEINTHMTAEAPDPQKHLLSVDGVRPIRDDEPLPSKDAGVSVIEWSFDSEYERLGFAALSSCGCGGS